MFVIVRCPKCKRRSRFKVSSNITRSPDGRTIVKAADPATFCPYCGNAILLPIRRVRGNPKGTGAHYARKIRRFSATHQLCLIILNIAKAYTLESGMTLTQIWLKARDFCLDAGLKVRAKGTLTGRLSELLALGLVESAPNIIDLRDRDTMTMRHREPPRWYLTPHGIPNQYAPPLLEH